MIRQQMEMIAFRIPKATRAKIQDPLLPKFQKVAGDATTFSDVLRCAVAFAMDHEAEFLKAVAA